MKIHSVSDIQTNKTLQRSKINNSAHITSLNFTGCDDFVRSKNYLDNKMIELKNNIDSVISPFKQQYDGQFILLGQIGLDAQEKLELSGKYETQLLQKKIYAADNETFKQAERKTADYKKYMENIQEFKRYEKLSEREPYSSNPIILKTIADNREKFTGNDDEFNKLKTYYDTVIGTKSSMSVELDKINLKNFPGTAEKIKALKDKHITVLSMLLFSDCILMTDICKSYNEITMAYRDKTLPAGMLLEKIYRQEENLQKFAENDNNRTDSLNMIRDFLQDNNNFKTASISQEEINSVYKKLTEKADRIIAEYTDYLKKYNADTKIKIDKKLINKTLKSQNSVNTLLSSLVQKEKEKMYKKSYDEFNAEC